MTPEVGRLKKLRLSPKEEKLGQNNGYLGCSACNSIETTETQVLTCLITVMFFASTTDLALQHFTSIPVNQAYLLGINFIVPSVCILVGGTGHFQNNILQFPTSGV